MKKLNYLILFLVFFIFASSTTSEVFAHPGYNSEEQVIGKYRVSTKTIPETPTTGEPTTIVFTIYDLDFNDIKNFAADIRIFYKDQQLDYIPITYIDGNHWDFDYTFEKPGNHVVRFTVDNAGTDGRPITYTFNISTLNPFGYMFIFIISSGATAAVGIMIWAILTRRKKSVL